MRRAAATTALALTALALPAPAAADTLAITDPARDTTRTTIDFDSGELDESPAQEPTVDILTVDIDNRTDRLEIVIGVQEAVALDDEQWEDGFSVSIGLAGPGGGDWFWMFDPTGPAAVLESFTETSITSCITDAAVDSDEDTYTFTADGTCVEKLPRTLQVQVGIVWDRSDPEDFSTVEFVGDIAPDDDLSDPVSTGSAAALRRLAGADRYATAIALSQDRFDDGEAAAAVLANGHAHADALAGAPLAVANGGPLLVNGRDSLDPRVRDELVRVLPPGATVHLLGGTAALGTGVESAIRALGFRPERIAGANRFETAVAVAAELPDHGIVLIADGRGFRDALVAGSAAAAMGGVLVLTDGETLPTATDELLASDPNRHVAIGAAAAKAAPGAERIVSPTSSELSVRVLERLLPGVTGVAVAGLGGFADALAGAAHAAAGGTGLLLTTGDELSGAVRLELEERAASIRRLTIYGGTASLSRATAEQISAALGA